MGHRWSPLKFIKFLKIVGYTIIINLLFIDAYIVEYLEAFFIFPFFKVNQLGVLFITGEVRGAFREDGASVAEMRESRRVKEGVFIGIDVHTCEIDGVTAGAVIKEGHGASVLTRRGSRTS